MASGGSNRATLDAVRALGPFPDAKKKADEASASTESAPAPPERAHVLVDPHGAGGRAPGDPPPPDAWHGEELTMPLGGRERLEVAAAALRISPPDRRSSGIEIPVDDELADRPPPREITIPNGKLPVDGPELIVVEPAEDLDAKTATGVAPPRPPQRRPSTAKIVHNPSSPTSPAGAPTSVYADAPAVAAAMRLLGHAPREVMSGDRRYLVLGFPSKDPRCDLDVAFDLMPGGAMRPCMLRYLPIDPDADRFVQRARFAAETKIAARLDDPSFVRVFDGGLDEGTPFRAREIAVGVSLRELVRNSAPVGVSLPAVVDLALAIARAIERVHSISEEDGTPLSVVHGELAPTSVFVTLDGRPVLTEPSVSHLGGRALRARIEARGGRSGYEAPEQRLRQPIDARTDVFSLGVLIAEMIGGTAFKTADLANLDGLGERIQAKCAARPNTPQLLIDLVHDMTALSPADRPPDMATVVGTLAWLRGRVGEWMDRPKELSGIFGQARSSMLAPAAAAWAAPEPSASPLAERCSEMTVDAIGPPQGLTMPPEEQIAPEVEAFATGGWVISEISEIPDAAADDPPRPADMGNREIAPDPRKRPLEHELANALEAALAEVDRDPDHDEGDPGSQRPPAAALPLTPPLAASPIAKQAMSEAEELDEALSAYERRERMLARAREHARAAVKAEEAAAPPLETPPPSKPRPSAPHLRVVEKQDGDVRDAELPAPVTSQRKRPRLSAVPPPIVDAQGKVPAPPSGNKSVSPWGKSDDEPLFGGSPAWVPPASRPAPGGSSSAPSAPSVSAAGAPAAASSTAPSRRAQRRAKQDPGVPADFQLTFDENDDGEGSKPLVVSSTRADAAISFGDGGPKASVAELASAMQNALADEELLPPEWTQAPRPSVAVPLPGATAGMPKAMPAAEPAPAAAPAPVPPSAKIVRGVPPPATAGAGRSKRAPLGQAPLPRNAPAAGAGAAPATPAAAIPSRPSDAQTLEASMLGAPIADLTPAAPQGKKSLAPPGVGNLQIAPRTQKRILGVAPLIFIAALLGLAGTAYALLWFLFARKPI